MCRVGLYTELLYAIITLLFHCFFFADLLSLNPVTFLMFFNLVYVPSFSSKGYLGPVLKYLARLQSCEKAIGWYTAQCKMLQFYMKTIVKGSCNSELACLKMKKERKENILAVWRLSGLVLCDALEKSKITLEQACHLQTHITCWYMYMYTSLVKFYCPIL